MSGFEAKRELTTDSIMTTYDREVIPSLINAINVLGSNFILNSDENSRIRLMRKARALFMALETPRETLIRHSWTEVRLVNATLKFLFCSQISALFTVCFDCRD